MKAFEMKINRWWTRNDLSFKSTDGSKVCARSMLQATGAMIICMTFVLCLYIPLSILLEESPYNKDLESTQRNDQNTLNNREPNDP